MAILFLFGAGASYGNVDINPAPPPLGSSLFKELKLLGGIASKITGDLAELFEKDFEKGMGQFFKEHPGQLTPFQQELALYFSTFRAGPNNYYSRLINILRKKRKKAVFSTTNYELLIEQAAMISGLSIRHTGMPIGKQNMSLLKIHGSCNFWPNIAPRQISGITFIAPEGVAHLEADVKVISPEQVRNSCKTEDSIGPALAIYNKGKSVLHCPSFVKKQQTLWQREVRCASKIFVIGLRVVEHDEHIWSFLAKSKCWLGYIGLEKNKFQNWAKKNSKNNAYAIANTFEDFLTKEKHRI